MFGRLCPPASCRRSRRKDRVVRRHAREAEANDNGALTMGATIITIITVTVTIIAIIIVTTLQ